VAVAAALEINLWAFWFGGIALTWLSVAAIVKAFRGRV